MRLAKREDPYSDLISLIRFSADLIAKAEIRLKYAIFSRQAGDQLRHGLMKAEYLILIPYRCCS